MSWLRRTFWRVVYAFRRQPRGFSARVRKAWRCRGRFQPGAWYNKDGNQWHVWLFNESAYTVSRAPLTVEAHIGLDTGRIVGITVCDENLKELAQCFHRE